MQIELVHQVNSRFSDGRVLSGMPGRRITVDDSDTDAVAHMKALVVSGDAVDVTPAPVEPEPVPTNEELRDDLRDRGLPTSGNKNELVERLAEDDEEQAAAKPAKKSTAKVAIDE